MILTFRRPVPKTFPISSKFGWRTLRGKADFHPGIDFAVPVGTPVLAIADGVAFRAGWQNDEEPTTGFGLRVMQSVKIAGQAYWLFYGHMSEVRVKSGDQIKAGQLLGLSGNTGNSTGPHLHIGCRKSDSNEYEDMTFVDPPSEAVA